MFYERQSISKKEGYKKMLSLIGSLSNLFSESDKPYLYYRCHENIFCKYFMAQNLSREDCSADAQKDNIGIGLKTWVDTDNQKIAEFNKLKNTYMNLSQEEMIYKISEYRNERIRITKNIHGIDKMIYHIVKRIPNAMEIYECSLEPIDIKKIEIETEKSNETNIYFTDKKHEYHFNISKSTLYMIFDNMVLMDSFGVNILDDPYSYLEKLVCGSELIQIKDALHINDEQEQLCLRLYTISRATNEKIVEKKSGLNQWNAAGRARNPNEIYIPYPKFDRDRSVGFFPPRDQDFNLILPDGKTIKAKVCQSDGKAIMSNPNSELGKWLLRDVFELQEGELVTYEKLKIYGIDSVIFTKIDEQTYKIDFTYIGTYEKKLGIEKNDEEE